MRPLFEGDEIWETKKRRYGLLTADIKNCFESKTGNLFKSAIQVKKGLRKNVILLMSTIQVLAELFFISVNLQSGWKQ